MKRKFLRVCHANVRSITAQSRLLDLEILTANKAIDVLCLTETWLTNKKHSNTISLPGFQIPFRKDRLGSAGGGVAVYVRNGLSASLILPPPSTNVECLCIMISLTSRTKLAVIVAYRPPGPGADAFCADLDVFLDSVEKLKPTAICLAGDFNAKVNEWYQRQSTDAAGKLLQQLALGHDLTQVVSEPTHSLDSENATPSLLDLMFIDKPHLALDCSVLPPLSDHCPTLLQIQLCGVCHPKPSVHFTWDYGRAAFDDIRDALAQIDWSTTFAQSDVNEAVAIWSTQVISILERFVPLKRHCFRSKSKPWYTPILHKLARQRDRLFKLSRKCSPSSPQVAAYKRVRNWYTAELRHAENTYYSSLSQKFSRRPPSSSSHHWWSQLKRAVNWSTRETIPPLSAEGSLHLSPSDKADALNRAFSKQCSAVDSCVLPKPSGSLPNTSFSFSPVSESTVLTALQRLNPWKACGLDKISNRFLKECAIFLCKPLQHIFNLSIQSGIYPRQWKVACIQPIFKNKGSRSNPVNYRPIALLCSTSKVFESVLKEQLLSFCLSHRLIPDSQFGFLPQRSTVWQLLSVTEDWHEALDAGKSVHALFLDVSKAFDRVNHRFLIDQCRQYGFDSTSLSWLESYLSRRTIVTSVNGALSAPLPISSGVPQGSVLGPLLFLLYFSTLPAAVKHSSTSMFADDTLLYNKFCTGRRQRHGSSHCCSLQDDTNAVNEWAKSSATVFNAIKSSSMLLSRSSATLSTPKPIQLDNVAIPDTSSVRHLGVALAPTLKWSEHVQNVVRSVGWKVSILKRLAYGSRISTPVFTMLYKTLVRPCLEYAGCVWDGCSSHDASMLERLQLSLARAILSTHLGTAYVSTLPKRQILLLLGWPTLAWRRRQQKLAFFWLLKNGVGPPGLREKLPASASDRCSYSLRSSHSSAVPLCSTSSHLSAFLPSTCIIWNSLPASVASASSVSSFTRLAKLHLQHDKFSLGLPR